MADKLAKVIDLTADSDDEGTALTGPSSQHAIANERIKTEADRATEQTTVRGEAEPGNTIDLTGDDNDETIALPASTATNEVEREIDTERLYEHLRDPPPPVYGSWLQREISPGLPPMPQRDLLPGHFERNEANERSPNRGRKRNRSPTPPAYGSRLQWQPSIESPPMMQRYHAPRPTKSNKIYEKRRERSRAPSPPSPPPAAGLLLERQISPERAPVVRRGTATRPYEIIDTDEIFTPTFASMDPPTELRDGLVMFADGSMIGKERVGGAGVAYKQGILWSGRAIALGQVVDSGEAEMRAVHEAFRALGNILSQTHRCIHIYTDSQDTIKCINKERAGIEGEMGIARQIVAEETALKEQGVSVEIRWVKGHNASVGNQMADLLAGSASRHSRIVLSQGAHKGPNRQVLTLKQEDLIAMSEKAERAARNKANRGGGGPAMLLERQVARQVRKMERREKKNVRRGKTREMEKLEGLVDKM